MNSVKYKKQSGLSLIETMVVLAIAGILLAYAIPNMRDFYLRQNLNTRANDFIVDLTFARAEAVNRGEDVNVVSKTTWKDGWQVTDKNDVVLRQSNHAESNVSFADTEDQTKSITFKSTGNLDATSSRIITFTLSDSTHKKTLTVALSGSASLRN